MTEHHVESRLTGSIVCVALVVISVCLDSSDPFGDAGNFCTFFFGSVTSWKLFEACLMESFFVYLPWLEVIVTINFLRGPQLCFVLE